MPRVYVDSNVFFYAKIMDRVYGRSCAGILRTISSGKLEASTSALVPVEVANALRKYRLGREVVGELRAIFSLPMEIYPIEPADVRDGAEVYGQVENSPYDCLHAAIMRRYGLKEIISADKDFDKFKWLRRLDPRSASEAAP